jgi:neutral ceramidase
VTRAGFDKVEISMSAIGAELMGYANRDGAATSVHDPLYVRAVAIECGDRRVALCSVDLCAVNEDVVAAARARVERECGVPAGQLLVSATHTHSAPHDDDSACWPDGLDARIAAAVAQACERLTPARVGAGWGLLAGHTLNRRRLEDPVDPAVFVMRIDAAGGAPLGVYYGFACHPVVLGPDNREVSGDWPGATARILEEALGPGAVAVFGQGACADVNPLTEGVRRQLAGGQTVYDRIGGTFDEAEHLGRAVAEEVLRVHRGVATGEVRGLWARRFAVATAHDGEPDPGPLGGHGAPRAAPDEPVDVMLLGIDGPDVVLLGQPGEVFGETGVDLRRRLREAGVRHPFVVGYANGWRAYLAPRSAYRDGGYEVEWARAMRLPETLQDDIRALVAGALGG